MSNIPTPQPSLDYERKRAYSVSHWHRRVPPVAFRVASPFVFGCGTLVLLGVTSGITFGLLALLGAVRGSGVVNGILQIFGVIIFALGSPLSVYLFLLFGEFVLKGYRERRAQLVLGYVEHAVRLNLPLVPFLAAAQRSERFATARRLRQVREHLVRGSALADALVDGVPELPPRAAALIVAGERNGEVGLALSRLIAEDSNRVDDVAGENRIMHRVYIALLFLALLSISVGMLVFVVPKFREIFRDFRTDLPPLTEALLSFASFFYGIEPALIFIFLALVLVWLCASLLRRITAPWWPPLISRNWLREHTLERLPIVGPMRENRELADICQSLADFTRQGRTFDEALGAVRRLTLSTRLENRLSEWHRRIVAGEDLAEAAWGARIPATLVGFLRTFRGGGNELSMLLEFLATYYRMKFSRSVLVLRAVTEPALTLLAGAVVGTFVIALFMPLVKLIQSVSGYSPGAL